MLLLGWGSPVCILADTGLSDSLVVRVDSIVPAACHGSSDGAIFLDVQGHGPFGFLWSTGDTTGQLPQVPAGQYGVTVTDSLGAVVVLDSIEVGQPDSLQLSPDTIVPPSCLAADGSLSVLATGGIGDYTYTWAQGASGTLLDSLPAGTYAVTVTDGNGCTAMLSLELVPTFPAVSLLSDGPLTCSRPIVRLDGATVPAGPNAVFQWSAGNGGTFTGPTDTLIVAVSSAGSYTLSVTDTLTGCTAEATVSVPADTVTPLVTIAIPDTLTCDQATISLAADVLPAHEDRTYQWSTTDGHILDGADTASPQVDAAGLYRLLVTDTLTGCSSLDSVRVSADTAPPTGTAQGGTLTCYQPLLTLTSDLDTNEVLFSWTGPGGFSSLLAEPLVSIAGDYTLNLTDRSSGCTDSVVVTVDDRTQVPVLQIQGGALTCTAATVLLEASASLPDLTWLWTLDSDTLSQEPAVTVTAPGWYTVLAQDTLYGCSALDSFLVVTDTLAPVVQAGEDLVFHCNLTSATLPGTLVAPVGSFSIQWSTEDGQLSGSDSTLSVQAEAPGTYVLTVTDLSNGCTGRDSLAITQVDPLSLAVSATDVYCYQQASGEAAVEGSGGLLPFTYAWSSGSTAATATGLVAGTYTVTVTDANACTAVAEVTVAEPTPLTVVLTATGQSLSGSEDGTLLAVPTGGIAPYTFHWNTGSTDSLLLGLPPGTYFVTVTDDKGCEAYASGQVNTFPCVLQATLATSPVVCHGTATGTASVAVENAVAPLAFVWSTGDTLATVGGLPGGVHTVTVSDSTQCSVLLNAWITEPTPLQVTELFHFDVACATDTDGLLVAAANGGVQPYAFTWSSGASLPFQSNLSAGTYELTVTDHLGCTAVLAGTVAVLDTTPPTLHWSPVTAYLDETGSATVAPEQFDAGTTDDCGLADWSVSQSLFGCQDTGTHSLLLRVTDTNGNESSALVTLTVLDTLTPVLVCPADQVTSLCQAIVSYDLPQVTDNCPVGDSLLVLVSGAPSGSIFPAGTTTVRYAYTDAGGRTGSCNFSVTVTDSLSTTVAGTGLSCHQACDGTLTLSPDGGVAPYQAAWSDGDTALVRTGLCAGPYMVTLTDASGCQQTLDMNVQEPDPLTLAFVELHPPLCPDGTDGSVAAQVGGGTGSYNLSWSTGATDTYLTDLGTGDYALTVTDANGCTRAGTVVLSAADSLAPELVLVQPLTLFLDAAGHADLTVDQFDAGSTDDCGISSWTYHPATFDCSQPGPVSVTVTAQDANGNVSAAILLVTVADTLAPALSCPADLVRGSCDSVVAYPLPQVTDNCPVDPAALALVQGLPPMAVFPAGVTVVTYAYADPAGQAASCSFTVTVAEESAAEGAVTAVDCADKCTGAVALTLSPPNAPVDILWSTGATGTLVGDLCAGTYSVVLTDAYGCQRAYEYEVPAPDPLVVVVDAVVADQDNSGTGSVSVSLSGGVMPYTFAWTQDGMPVGSTEDLTGLSAGLYSLLATDANGCTITAQVAVDNLTGTRPALSRPAQLVLPNPADAWLQVTWPATGGPAPYRILDARGQLRITGILSGGNTRLAVDALPAGTYVLQVDAGGTMWHERFVIVR